MCSKIIVFAIFFLATLVTGRTAPANETNPRKSRSINNCDCICGKNYRHMRVVGGNEADAHEFPWLVGLTRDGEIQCGASLITKRHLLTAAHCVNGFDIREMSVVLADHNRVSPNRLSTIVVRGLRSIREHERFDKYSFNNDIAILEMDSPVDFTTTVQPACLPRRAADYTGRDAVVAGWGKTGENEITSNILRKVTLPVWSRDQCLNSNYGQRKISDNMFCAGFPAGKQDACQGDSGGPLHMNNANSGVMEIIGLVSWGRGCARPNLPGIYTKVTNYLDWVNNALNGECLCRPQIYA
ncbi:trypsin-1-like [Coccinella septempunctata]|uniref:trypsin-1-like n=1 Tax=Coccinella septempunctata TaxID=41139 RepID=UPI001D06F331|nr:trypsin-1-like [Coccinella septempunctata]